MSTLQVGDLVQYVQAPTRLGIVMMVHTTSSGAEVCEVILVHDSAYPDTVGEKRYLNQDYWKKAETRLKPLDAAIQHQEAEYEEVLDLYMTYSEG